MVTEEIHEEKKEKEKVIENAPTPSSKVNNMDQIERLRPPFPQGLKKWWQDSPFKKSLDILKQVHINVPLVEMLEQMSNYLKFPKDSLA